MLNKPVILILPGSSSTLKFANDPFYHVAKIFESINLSLFNAIILYSLSLINEWDLEKYEDKILIARRHFLDFKKFSVIKSFNQRNNCVGYIGRLSGEKGIFNLIEAIPEILGKFNDIEFLIIGDGDLKEKINSYLYKHNLSSNVRLLGWVPHDELPSFLNKLKLVILPSYTEGLPNIMLEAMACGTPVLATSVGAIPDVITDDKTGFIMENNSPECIAENVIRALNSPDMEQIAEAGKRFVEKNFTFESVVERWKELLEEI